ncbi:hypothetical protein CROQUDRAFT_670709 [Cronartium quercuum f. sp. fusiforme G11]|uniref:Peptidase A1 domain-containing protein n=1 Tax=Cronartium quercuum f. sp. fusiforme G11 TaxID=708437 RepID=A0A9P6NN92_9BASI|nr:hypothetical protein CROQUDRAFT_670709 [Cronartium quercuum f. sp. fusiforme G11]
MSITVYPVAFCLHALFLILSLTFQNNVLGLPFSSVDQLISVNVQLLDRTPWLTSSMNSYHSVHQIGHIAQQIYARDCKRAAHLILPTRASVQSPSTESMKLKMSVEMHNLEDTHPTTVVATNTIVSYLADIKVGVNGQSFKLIIDTGSSNTWIGSRKPLQRTSSTVLTGTKFSISYGSGSAWGDEVLDNISLSPSTTVKQSIGIASKSYGFSDVDGILGVGPSKLTLGTQSVSKQEVPTIIDTLFRAKKISRPILGVSFVPTRGDVTQNGRLTFGGVDNSLFLGQMAWIPRTSTKPSSSYYGVNLTITAAGSPIMVNKAGIMDTGTTLILLPNEAFDRYVAKIPNATVLDDGLVMFPESSIHHIPQLGFDFGVFHATLSAEQQVLPMEEAHYFGASTSKRFSYVAALGTPAGEGLDFIIGQKFLEHYYTAYNSKTGAVGIAPSAVKGR